MSFGARTPKNQKLDFALCDLLNLFERDCYIFFRVFLIVSHTSMGWGTLYVIIRNRVLIFDLLRDFSRMGAANEYRSDRSQNP